MHKNYGIQSVYCRILFTDLCDLFVHLLCIMVMRIIIYFIIFYYLYLFYSHLFYVTVIFFLNMRIYVVYLIRFSFTV